jgi:hypothetical protein
MVRPICFYDEYCYDVSEDHWKRYSHPGRTSRTKSNINWKKRICCIFLKFLFSSTFSWNKMWTWRFNSRKRITSIHKRKIRIWGLSYYTKRGFESCWTSRTWKGCLLYWSRSWCRTYEDSPRQRKGPTGKLVFAWLSYLQVTSSALGWSCWLFISWVVC